MSEYADYYAHLQSISPLGRIYKRYVVSPMLYYQARKFGFNIAEIGCGIGSGILGAYPKHVTGFDINPLAVDYCKVAKLNAHLIEENQKYPAHDGQFDVCALDNVLEHIAKPDFVLEECLRITRNKGGLVIAVPGTKGYQADPDHKLFYGDIELRNLHPKWRLMRLFSIPFLVRSKLLSERVSQYCLVAVYQKQTHD